jgi:hypothetical protein
MHLSITACTTPPHKKQRTPQRTPKNIRKAHQKIRMLTTWSKRSTQSAMKDLEEILEILEELPGDDSHAG